jgi:hypothetical protein
MSAKEVVVVYIRAKSPKIPRKRIDQFSDGTARNLSERFFIELWSVWEDLARDSVKPTGVNNNNNNNNNKKRKGARYVMYTIVSSLRGLRQEHHKFKANKQIDRLTSQEETKQLH